MGIDISNPAEAWGTVAEAWDAGVDDADGVSAEATTTMIDRLAVGAGDHLLELGAGPGALGAVWSQLVGEGGKVVLSDLAPGMVEVARRRNATLANVATAVIDLAAIDQPDESFDVVVSRMGLMFTPEPARAFAEIRRVLRPMGRFGALTWAGMEHNPWMTCVGMAAAASGIVAGGPPVGPGGIFSLTDAVVVTRLVEDAGLGEVRVDAVPVAFHAESVDAHIDRVSSLAGPLAVALRGAPPDRLDSFRRMATDLAAPYLTDGRLVIPGLTLLITARR